MKDKRILTVLLLLSVMLLFCACGNQANQEDSATVIPEPTEEAAEAEIPSETAEPEPDEAPAEETELPEETEEPAVTAEPEIVEEPEEIPEETVEPEETVIEAAEEAAEPEEPAIEAPEETPEPTELAAEEPEEIPEPEEERFKLVIPAEYAEPSYRIGEVEWNQDGSVTYSLTAEEHEQLLREVHAYIQEELDTMCASPYFLHFDSMTANEDCRIFTVVVIDIWTSKAEQKSIPQLYELGRMYAAYEGVEPGNIHIDYMTKLGTTLTRDSEKDEALIQK